jgi:hypothetical protein
MDKSPPIFPQPSAATPTVAADPRLQPTPDYGLLGPGSDIANGQVAAGGDARTKSVRAVLGPAAAVAVGGLLAALWVSVGSARGTWGHLSPTLSSANRPALSPTKDRGQLDRLKPQKQAETLLELAVGNPDGAAVDQISTRTDSWRGKLKWNPQLATLTTAALNSNNLRVRESGIEVQLSAYGLGKSSSNVDSLVNDAASSNHARKVWALWTLGAMANRGVETERVTQVLTSHLKDSDEDSRRWAVEALALVGTTSTVEILLDTMHNDGSPLVRERAACSLAESGMLSHEQRLTSVPVLLNYTDDPSLDAQTHAWAFQALGDITKQRLPNDSNVWRNWYQNNRVGN